jgi:hypothetical protein
MSNGTSAVDSIGRVATEIGLALVPLQHAVQTPEAAATLLNVLGWELPPGITDLQLSNLDLSDLIAKIEAVSDLTPEQEGDLTLVLEKYGELIAAIAKLIAAIEQIVSAFANLPADYLSKTNIVAEFLRRLLDLLILEYAQRRANTVSAFMQLAGIFEVQPFPADPSNYQTSHLRRIVHYDRIGWIFSSDHSIPKEVYGWGTPNLLASQLLVNLARVIQAFGGRAPERPLPRQIEEAIVGHSVPEADTDPVPQIRVSLVEGLGFDDTDVGFAIYGLRASSAGAPDAGFGLSPFAKGSTDLSFPLSDTIPISLEIDTKFDIEGGIDLLLRPGSAQLKLGTPAVSGRLGLGVTYGDPATPTTLLAITGGSHLDVKQVGALAGASFVSSTAIEPFVELKISGGKLVISLSQSDGFVAKLMPSDGIILTFDLGAGWSPSRGVYFTGSASLEFAIPLGISLGPIHIDTLHVVIGVSASGLTLELSVDAGGTLGPVSASVERIGAKAALDWSKKGNLGPVNLGLAFKSPVGLGITLDAGPITGGGFIEYDPDAGRYAGVLALSLYSIQVKAIGLLDTKLPNGESGYSFLIIISVEFTPIQLGFGFTLNGVGGLCGINRDFVSEALQAGLRAHSLDHILFPKDPVKNAPAIISDLRTIFPPAEGRYVFGPMVELGWGGGLNLVTAEFGILLALPSPVVIAILGQLNVNVPSPDAAVIELHLDVLGIIDFGKKLFSLDASLHDSRIVVFTIFGDMALRLSWGDNPSFALSIGGLNPHFQPPDGFPQLKRLTISLSASDFFRLSIQTYFAITSNSFQFGAHAELYIGVSAFNVYGWLGFDALFIFKPFSFIVDFTAGLALRSGTTTLLGISLDGELSGPTPWHAKGEAHVTLLFFDIGVHVDITWGQSGAKASLPEVDAWPQLQTAIGDLQNWSGALPAGVPAPVTLSMPKADPKAIYVDPSGALTMRERVLPLNQVLTKFGEAVPGPQNQFSLKPGGVSLGGVSTPFTIVRDKFAPAQFEELSDQDKLSRPSFEDRDAGFAVGDGALTTGQQFGVDLVYDDIYVDDHAATTPPPPFAPALELQVAWALSNGAAKSPLRAAALSKFIPAAGAQPLVDLSNEQYVVASTNDLSQRLDITQPVTKGEAFQALAAHLAQNPNERGQLQVMPLSELAA